MEQDNLGPEEREVTDELDCPVCLEAYNEGHHIPKMMPCLHTLCASCIICLTTSVTKSLEQPSTFSRRDSQPTLLNPSTREDSRTANHTASSAISSNGQNHVISTLASVMQTSHKHPLLRRVAGHGPSTPISQHPHDPLLSPQGTSKPLRPSVAHKPKVGLTVSVKRPDVSPPLPPKPGVASSNTEPQIPKNIVVQCPLCRSEINTSKLQTNRYILAHMRDRVRLSIHSPSSLFPASLSLEIGKAATSMEPTCPSKALGDLWCGDCKHPASDACVSNHELIPIAEWVETQKATVESLKMAVEDKLGQHTAYLQSLQKMIKGVYHSLNKASRHVWEANKKVEDLREGLFCQLPNPVAESQQKMAEALMEQVRQLERLAKRISAQDLLPGDAEVTVSFRELQQQILITTNNSDTSIIISIAEGQKLPE